MVGTWDFWPNYHYIQCISPNSLSQHLIYDCIHFQSIPYFPNKRPGAYCFRGANLS